MTQAKPRRKLPRFKSLEEEAGRTGGSIFHGARGSFVMAAFCEGGAAGGTGRESEGNVLLGDLGYAAWRALAAPVE